MSRTELEPRSSECKAHTLATGIPSYQVINTFACFYDKDFIENNVLKNLFHRCNNNIQSWNREIKEITTFKVYRVHSTYVWLRTGGSRWLQPLPPLNSKKDRIKMYWNTQKRCKKLRKKRETFYVFVWIHITWFHHGDFLMRAHLHQNQKLSSIPAPYSYWNLTDSNIHQNHKLSLSKAPIYRKI